MPAQDAKCFKEAAIDSLPGSGANFRLFLSRFSGLEEPGDPLAAQEAAAFWRDGENAVFARFLQEALGGELLDPIAGAAFAVVGQKTPGAELVVAVFKDSLVARAAEDLSRVFAAEGLIQSQDAGEDFLADDEGVLDEADLAETDVASLAGFGA